MKYDNCKKIELQRLLYSKNGRIGKLLNLLIEYKAEILLLMRRNDLCLRKIKIYDDILRRNGLSKPTFHDLGSRNNRNISTIKRANRIKYNLKINKRK